MTAGILALLGCSRANPRFDADSGSTGDVADQDTTLGAGSGELETGVSGVADSAATEGVRETDGQSDLGGPVPPIVLFLAGPTNGSFEVGAQDGVGAADLMCVAKAEPRCMGQARAFVFPEPGGTLPDLLVHIDLPELSAVETPAGIEIAPSLAQFIQGPHTNTLAALGLGDDDVGVWTGLNPAASGNCGAWTSGKGDRLGGAGSLVGEQAWARALAVSCGDELPFLCLCPG